MDGYVDYVAPNHGVTLRKKTWKRRFLRLDAAFHALEVFTDAAMGKRKQRIALMDARIATAEELGALLSTSTSSKIALEHSRRFVLRITEREVGTQHERHHYMCAEVQAPDNGDLDAAVAVDVRASRMYLQQWLDALRQCVRSAAVGSISSSGDLRMDARELSRCIAAYSERLHLAAFVSNRDVEQNKSVFEITVKAWILQRELVADDDKTNSDSDERGQRRPATSSSSWEVLEYACTWKVRKTTAELRDFDAQLRQFCNRELRDVAVPSSSPTSLTAGVVHHLLHSTAHAEQERVRRVAAIDAYVQQLLCLPAFSVFGSDASAMLDHFLEITPHLAPLRQLEKASGQSMHLRTRQVVPWRLREQFEHLYRLHLESVQAKSDAAQRPQTAQRTSKHEGERRRSAKPYRYHDHNRRRESSKPHARSSHVDNSDGNDDQCTSQTLEAVRPASAVEDTDEHIESVHERIAKIGKKLITEAFMHPESPHLSARATST